MSKYLFVFTNSFPFGNGYQWLKNELDIIHSAFEIVHIFPFSYEGKKNQIPVPPNITVHTPVFDVEPNFNNSNKSIGLLSPRLPYYFKEFYKEKIYTNNYWVKSWFAATAKTEALLGSSVFSFLKEWPHKEETCLYFYWGINMSLLVPFLTKLGFNKIVVRFHGFDLYKERLGGYQPYRRSLLKSLSLAAPISDKGKAYLLENYPEVSFSVKTCRLGSVSKGLSISSKDGVFRIFSCARLIKLKRISMIAEALGLITKQEIEWTHLGDGDEMPLLQEKVKSLPKNIQVNLVGWVNSGDVLDYYVGQKADLFLNVSTTEGVPVSIMEAYSAGIPALATDVGGTRELVNNLNGILVNSGISKEDLAEQILKYINTSPENKENKRQNAFETHSSKADAEKLFTQFVDLLKV